MKMGPVDETGDEEMSSSGDAPDEQHPNDQHPFDAASRDADTDPDDAGDVWPPSGRIDVVAEPIRYRQAPVYALLAIAVLPAIGLLALHRWADDEADRYDAEVARIEAERSLPAVSLDEDVSTTTSTTSTMPPEGSEQAAGEIDDASGPDTELLSYRRTPSAIASLANARSLATTLVDFSGRLDTTTCFAASVDGVRVAAHGPTSPLIPASNQKLLVGAVALDVLGPDHVFETSVAVPAPVDGEVDGDIYLIGGGDPLLTSDDYPIEEDRYPAFNTTSFDVLADSVVNAGVTRIRGTVIGDGTRYDDEFTVESWASGVAGVDAGPYDALVANDARVRGRSGRESDPNVAAAREFVRLLGDRGVRVDNGWGSGSRSTLVPVVGTVTSAPLSDVVEEMLVNSDNDTAELLVKELGVVVRGEGTRTAGLEVIRSWLVDRGITTLGVQLADGSGLSNDNRLTCDVVLAVLEQAGDDFADVLAVAGRTGTLDDELIGSAVEGQLRAKTGTLNRGGVDPPSVKALSGYLPATGAGTIEFALISNTPGSAEETVYQVLWNALAERLATHPAGPDATELGPTPPGE